MTARLFSNLIIAWHKRYGRHDLPWQKNRTPYRVWVSEIMLQQTQVSTVIPYFQKFMKRFPTVKSLAQAKIDDVLLHWSGLGYYARARNLHKCAGIIHQQYQGRFPQNVEALSSLPGIGRSTAGAILSLSMDIPAPILDGNVKRVMARYHAIEGLLTTSAKMQQLWAIAESHLPTHKVREYNQALMDLGATVCLRKNPECQHCPLIKECKSHIENKIHLIPQAKSTKTLPIKTAYFLILVDKKNQVLLEKRADIGLWASLWSFPLYERDIQNLESLCSERFGLKIVARQTLPEFTHKFSHFTLKLTPLWLQTITTQHALMDSTERVWYKLRSPLPGGISQPVARLLNEL